MVTVRSNNDITPLPYKVKMLMSQSTIKSILMNSLPISDTGVKFKWNYFCLHLTIVLYYDISKLKLKN